jgi:hypothetical protein
VLGIDTVGIMKGSKKATSPTSSSTPLDPEVQAEIAKLKKGSPAVTNAKLDPSGQAAGRLHHARAVEKAGDHHRSQAARREDRGMAQVVCREHHELTMTGARRPPRALAAL